MPYRVGQSTGHLLGLVAFLLPAMLLALERRRFVVAALVPRRDPALRPAPPRARRHPARARLRVGAGAAADRWKAAAPASAGARRRARRRPLGGLGLDRGRPLLRAGRAVLRGALRLRHARGRERRRGARLRRLADAAPRARRPRRDPGAARARARPRPRRARALPARARREPARLRDALAGRPRPRLDARPGAVHADRMPRARGARGVRGRAAARRATRTSPPRRRRGRSCSSCSRSTCGCRCSAPSPPTRRTRPTRRSAATVGCSSCPSSAPTSTTAASTSATRARARVSGRRATRRSRLRAADRLARELRGLSCGRGSIPSDLGVRFVAVHRGLYAQSGFFGAGCPSGRRRCCARTAGGSSPATGRSRRTAARVRRPPQRSGDGREVRAPELLRHRREDVVPDRGEAHPELRHPRRPAHEPEMEVLAAVAPAAHVDATDVADRVDRALDADDQRPELGCAFRRELVEVAVLARVEDHDDRQPARLRAGATSQCSSLQITSSSPFEDRQQSPPSP